MKTIGNNQQPLDSETDGTEGQVPPAEESAIVLKRGQRPKPNHPRPKSADPQNDNGRPGSPRGGTVQEFVGAKGKKTYRGRVTTADGKRIWLEPVFTDESRAREYTAEKAAEIRVHGITESMVALHRRRQKGGETCDQYFERLARDRSKRVGRVESERTLWRVWVSPIIGHLPIATVTADEVEGVREELDRQVDARIQKGLGHGLTGSTTGQIWFVVKLVFKQAVASKNRSLRMRKDNPTGVLLAPGVTPLATKTFIYPVECTQLLGCEEVAAGWRAVYALAMYLYLRPEELLGLVWTDVDFVAGTVSINKAKDWRTGDLKSQPKNVTSIRTVPIEDALLPLLRVLHERRKCDSATVLTTLDEASSHHAQASIRFRKHLVDAGVSRHRLFDRTPTLHPINFRSCRDTGITWLALIRRRDGERAIPVEAMMSRCGHRKFETTLRYVRLAEALGKSTNIGSPFPPIPQSLIDCFKR